MTPPNIVKALRLIDNAIAEGGDMRILVRASLHLCGWMGSEAYPNGVAAAEAAFDRAMEGANQ